ncbi:Copia protein [Vitis vinifera]|uniref:Copia protein n=1 Tax=Vitis vinifera TaxID=29760 RepID=A0A438CTN3_VITVI|nr:Copia protein [Vitis vinifera]
MTYDQGLFKELDKTITSKVRIGNGAYLVVKGKGTVAIEGHTGLKLISNVLYVPEINQNMLSVGQLLEKNYKVLFEDNHCMIADAQGREVFIVQMKGKRFTLDLMQEEQAAIHKEESNTMLWHRCLGHFHHTTLLFMKKNDLGEGLPKLEVKPPTCVACIEHQLTTPYTPHQNGVVEKKNRTLVEMTRFLLHDKGLPKKFWAEAAHTSVFLLNRLPTKALQQKTPFEAWGTKSLSNTYQRCNVAIIEPTEYEEDAADKKWMDTMKEELKMIEKKPNLGASGQTDTQKGNWSQTFSPVAGLDTIRMLLALAAQKEWNIHQMDVKSTFLNGYLEEEIFVEQPEGFIVKGMEEKVCDETLVVSLYVDDLLVIGSSMEQINNFKKEMKDVFEMTDLGRMTFFLGMKVQQK